ncbi:vWA domain-containing protein [Paracoccus aminophilus]|uniref:Serine/threonine-protein kinase n=1 Tax=Paracoccus aminophilus JCM 7686 TaxID=1367847 RepID=S5XS33_PARAH|nr:vWA domain-containing protein [Paracoccus aminophilus]AGT07932.1 serine/threonine-protein kinase [Paracoccus aminophilus JCM 7686]
MAYLRRTVIAGLLLASAAQAEEACVPKFQAQKLELTQEISAISRSLRKLQARIDGQELRLAGLGEQTDRSTIAKLPELPKAPAPVLTGDKGCTTELTAELSAAEQVRTELDAAQKIVEEREAALTLLESGDAAPVKAQAATESPTPAATPASPDSTAGQTAAAAESKGPDTAKTAAEDQTKPAEPTTVAASETAKPAEGAEVVSSEAKPAESESKATDTAKAAAKDQAKPAEGAEIASSAAKPEESDNKATAEDQAKPTEPNTVAASEAAKPAEGAEIASSAAKPEESAAKTAPEVQTTEVTPSAAEDRAAAETASTETAAVKDAPGDEAMEPMPEEAVTAGAAHGAAAAAAGAAIATAPETGSAEQASPANETTTSTAATTEPEVPAATTASAPENETAALAKGPMPLAVPDNPDLFQRVISLPDLQLHDAPGITDPGTALPAFSVLYVFERRDLGGESWLQLGTALNKEPLGWARAAEAMDWSTMLVMQFAPRGKRNRVLFFNGDAPLTDLISGPFYQTTAVGIYEKLGDERRKLAQDPDYKPQWNTDLVAIEPETAVRYGDKPYLLPILDWRNEMFDGTADTTLVKVAALPAGSSAKIAAKDDASFASSAKDAAAKDDEFRVGVVFVVDTTVSMRPFIDRTYAAIQGFYDAFSKVESAKYISFGLTGFRDNIDSDPKNLEYVTRNFQPLDPDAPAQSILNNMKRMTEARVSNLGFAEDSLAGLTDAIDENDWSPYDARIIILVTDASARTDAKAKYPDMTLERLREKARAQNITIIPIHLLTPANKKEGDAEVARAQYQKLAQTGDLSEDKYLALDVTRADEFQKALEQLARDVATSTLRANAGEILRGDTEKKEPMPADQPAAAEAADAPEVADAADPGKAGDISRLSDIVGNEIFRAQLESLGRVEGSAAPAFLAGWAADRDLTNPDVETLEVSVYLSRNQLSTLDKRLEAIIEAFRSGGQDPQAFFANLQMLAAQTSSDPESLRQGDRATIEAILPSFLKKLPYRSQVLRLDQSYWSSMSVSQQQEFIENLEAKRKIYADLFGQTEIWADFGAGDPGLEATPVRLVNLP